ncbi:hypothetical protein AB0H76_06230 [Nocardia sp. NPDC050712]|uniref:hypothetical protein n=1 Tax=Nocardia sp. NPDC050712 TaxID=3155518 RepID=UPI00340A5FC4
MFSLAALVPSPPILVPELGGARAGTADDPVAPLRAAALAAVRALETAGDWLVVGAGESDRGVDKDSGVGTFRGYGADVRVAMSQGPLLAQAESDAADPDWPLPALVAGWLRGEAAAAANVLVAFVDPEAPAEECVAFGRAIRADLDRTRPPTGVLVIADGAATLTTKSPGYLNPQAATVQEGLDKALAAGDVAALRALDPRLCAEVGLAGRAAYQVLAGLFADDASAPTAETLYQDAPFGVGYHVGTWRPGGAS